MSRAPLFPVVLFLFLVASCEAPDVPSASVPAQPEVALTLASQGGLVSPGFRFLPPLAPESPVGGNVDLSQSPRVEVCRVASDDSLDCGTTPTFPEGTVRQVGEHYEVLWRSGESDALEGRLFQIEVWLGQVRLGYQQVEFEAQGGVRARGRNEQAGTDRTVPIRFRIEEDAVLRALQDQCEIGGVIVDCDVQMGDGSEETTLTVRSGDGSRVAGLVRIPVQDDHDFGSYLASLRHLAHPIGGASIPSNDQTPFFLQVDAVDGGGNPVSFTPAAYLALCQPSDVSTGSIASLNIFRVSDGLTEVLDTQRNTPECFAGHASSGAWEDTRPFLRRGIDAVAGLLRAQPLGALHGGLNTTTSVFSEFGATLADEAPFGYSGAFAWEGSAGSGIGPAPFFTPGDFSQCPNLSVEGGTGGSTVWPLGGTGEGEGSILTLEKSFLVPSGAKGIRVWAAIDNDIQVRVNGTDITGSWIENPDSSGKPGSSAFQPKLDSKGFLVHEGCAWIDSVYFTAAAKVLNPGAANQLQVIARDRGSIGYVNVRVEVID